MSVSVYLAKPHDTFIANRDRHFIAALERTAELTPSYRVVADASSADAVVVDERYDYRTWRYAKELDCCSFIRKHIDRLCVINHDSHARVFLPGLYASLEKSRPSMVPACAAPYKWDLWQVPVPRKFEFRPTSLFAFRGTFHTHRIRNRLYEVLNATGAGTCQELRKAFHSHTAEDQRHYINDIRNARFSLCPRGLSPNSYRIYETMQLGRCPVIISDDWIPPPGLGWDEFILRVREAEIHRLPEILARESDRAEKLGRKAYDQWWRHLSWPERWRYFLNSVVQFREERGEKFDYGALRDMWHDKEFLRLYDWTMLGKAKQLAVRKYNAIRNRPVGIS